MFFAFETGDKIPIPRWLIQKSEVLKMFSKYGTEIVYMDHIFPCYACLQIMESIADNRTAPLHILQYIPLFFDYLMLDSLAFHSPPLIMDKSNRNHIIPFLYPHEGLGG